MRYAQFSLLNEVGRATVPADFRSARWSTLLELRQEPHIVFKEFADVVDSVFKHGNTINAHSKGKAGITVGIVSNVFIQCRMNHS